MPAFMPWPSACDGPESAPDMPTLISSPCAAPASAQAKATNVFLMKTSRKEKDLSRGGVGDRLVAADFLVLGVRDALGGLGRAGRGRDLDLQIAQPRVEPEQPLGDHVLELQVRQRL